MLKRVKSNILRQTEAGGPVGGRGGRVEPHPAHVARHVHADRSHRSLPPQKYFVGAENIVNRSDAVRSEDNLSLTDRGCNTVQCTAPQCTALYNCTAEMNLAGAEDGSHDEAPHCHQPRSSVSVRHPTP